MVLELVVNCVGIVTGGTSSLLTGRLPTKGVVTSVAAISVTRTPDISKYYNDLVYLLWIFLVIVLEASLLYSILVITSPDLNHMLFTESHNFIPYTGKKSAVYNVEQFIG